MYQLTSLIQNTPEVYLSRSVALISESGSRVPHDTLKEFLNSLGFVESLLHYLKSYRCSVSLNFIPQSAALF
jgi:hypothetical protein